VAYRLEILKVIEVIILALALSMDAFAVSIGLGSKFFHRTTPLAIMAGVYFGFFQGVMPLIGYLGGRGALGWIGDYASWIACIILFLIGSKMIYESILGDLEKDIEKIITNNLEKDIIKNLEKDNVNITYKLMLVLAIATSIDALAAGFTLTILDVNPFIACAIIGMTTLVFSGVGVFVGAKSGTWLETKAELFGGIVLILIGFKLLFT
jgi:putative Mn2+ efflux pump MntP